VNSLLDGKIQAKELLEIWLAIPVTGDRLGAMKGFVESPEVKQMVRVKARDLKEMEVGSAFS